MSYQKRVNSEDKPRGIQGKLRRLPRISGLQSTSKFICAVEWARHVMSFLNISIGTLKSALSSTNCCCCCCCCQLLLLLHKLLLLIKSINTILSEASGSPTATCGKLEAVVVVVGGVVYTRYPLPAPFLPAWLNLSAAVKILIMPTTWAAQLVLRFTWDIPSAEQSQHASQKLGANLVVVIIVLWRRRGQGGMGRARNIPPYSCH